MMEEQERAMRETDDAKDRISATDAAAVRAALAAHPWPRFGEALQARLMAIPSTAPSSAPAAPPAADRPTREERAPTVLPFGGRRWWREALAMAVAAAAVAGLALALAGTARLRRARPVHGLETPTATPMPVSTPTVIAPADGLAGDLTGKLVYILAGDVGGDASVHAIDMSTGRDDLLWEAPGLDTEERWAVSRDGTRLAFTGMLAATSDGAQPRGVYVRSLFSGAPALAVEATPVDVHQLVWSSDSSTLYDGMLTWDWPAGAEGMPIAAGWELHQLAVDPPSPGIDGIADQVLVRLDADAIAALSGNGTAELAAVDAVSHRAAVTAGPGENGQVDAIVLFDMSSGRELQRIPGGMEGFRAAANRGGTKLAYTDCADCGNDQVQDDHYRLRVLTLATGAITDIASPGNAELNAALLVWSPDDRWLAWKTFEHDTYVVDVAAAAPDPIALDNELGNPVAFTPDGSRLLTSSGTLVDLNEPVGSGRRTRMLPWALQGWMNDWDGVRRVITWAPDTERAAGAPAEVPPAPAGPADVAARPVLTDGMRAALDSQIYYRTNPTGGEPIAVHRLDMRSGRSEPIWEAPRSMSTAASTDTIVVLSPDRSRVAVTQRAAPGASSSLYVSALDRTVPAPRAMIATDGIQSIEWADDGSAVYYARQIPGAAQQAQSSDTAAAPTEPGPEALAGWEFHRVALTPSGNGGLFAWVAGDHAARPLIEAGEDRVLVRLDAATLQSATDAFLVDVDENARRVVVNLQDLMSDELENDIVVLDLDTGAVVDRLGSAATQGFRCPQLAVPGTLSCYGGDGEYPDLHHRYGRLELATRQMEVLWSGSFAQGQWPIFPSPDGRWLVGVHLPSQTGSASTSPTLEPSAETREVDFVDLTDASPQDRIIPGLTGQPKSFFPGTSVLLTSDGKMVDLDGAVKRGEAPITLPWTLPEPLRGEFASILGWFANTEAPTKR